MSGPLRTATGWVVPGNRWDLLPAPADPPSVTAVVLHYRDPARLALVLAGLEAQTHPSTRLQVVVADDGSPEAPRVPSHVTLVSQDDRGFRAAAARNLGAAAADGDVLCFLDGDTVPEPGYVAAASALPAVGRDVLVVGRRRHADLAGWTPREVAAWFDGHRPPPPELTEPAWLRDAYRDSADLLHADERSYRFVISAVLTVHRDLFAATGGFDETFTEYGGEDWDLAHRAVVAGAVLAHRRDAVAWHDGPAWEERGDPDTAREQKDRETLALARRIPDRAARGGGYWASAPRVLVEVTGGTRSTRVLCARDVVRGCDDALVVVDAGTAAAADHPQIVDTPPDRCILQRIPWRVRIARPVRLDPATGVGALVERARAEGLGRLTTADGLVEVRAVRAVRRGERHGVDPDLLFPTATVPELPPLAPDTPVGRELSSPA